MTQRGSWTVSPKNGKIRLGSPCFVLLGLIFTFGTSTVARRKSTSTSTGQGGTGLEILFPPWTGRTLYYLQVLGLLLLKRVFLIVFTMVLPSRKERFGFSHSSFKTREQTLNLREVQQRSEMKSTSDPGTGYRYF